MTKNIKSITERALNSLKIPELWERLQLPGVPARSCKSPFRPDRSPSFSVYQDGRLWKDHATNEGGDAISFIAAAHDGMSRKEAWKIFCVMAGTLEPDGWPSIPSTLKPAQPMPPPVERPPDLSLARLPTDAEITSIAIMRGLSVAGVRVAVERGFLLSGNVCGHEVWITTDNSRRVATARRFDGQMFTNSMKGTTHKSHALSSKSVPVGLHELGPPRDSHAVLFCEGESDFLTACHFIAISRMWNLHPVAVLGRTQNLSPEACHALAGWRIRFYPHNDPDGGGANAVARWAGNIPDAECDAYSFEGTIMADGSPVNDLNDYARIEPGAQDLGELLPLT